MTRSVSVILAAHNEAVTIADVVRGCRQHTPDLAEVIVVDDGSKDATSELAIAAGAQVFRLVPNRGKGVAVRHGIKQATGDTIVLLDADGQDDPAEIPLLLNALVDGVDLVIGSRFLGHFGPGAITPLNRAGNQFLTRALNAIYGSRVTDTQAGFKALRLSAIDPKRLKARRFDIEVEVLAAVLRGGGKVVEVPVNRAARVEGKSRLNSFRDGAIILKRIVQARFQ